MLGNNMFAYCLNNPVNCYDPGGTAAISYCNGDRNPLFIGYIGIGGGGGGGSIGGGYGAPKSIPDAIELEKTIASKKTGTTTKGLSISLAYIVAVSIDIGITYDRRGNIGFLFSYNFGGGSPSASINQFVTKTNAPDIHEQNGLGLTTGGSCSIPGTIASVGMDGNMLMDDRNNATYWGSTVSAGVGLGLPAEYHCTAGKTHVGGFNIWDALLGEFKWEAE